MHSSCKIMQIHNSFKWKNGNSPVFFCTYLAHHLKNLYSLLDEKWMVPIAYLLIVVFFINIIYLIQLISQSCGNIYISCNRPCKHLIIFCRYRLHFAQDTKKAINKRKEEASQPLTFLPEVRLLLRLYIKLYLYLG